MGKINYVRVILCGLLAGLVLNLGEAFLNFVVLAGQWEEALRAINKEPPGGSMTVVFVILGFVLGWAIVWVYAAIRPRMGPGPRTAICAGLAVWFLSYAWPSLSGMPMGIFPNWLFIISIAWGLIEVPLAALAGAWLYKE